MDVRSFISLRTDRRQRLAMWVHGDFVGSGTAPYFDLPALGTGILGRSGSGYTEGRFRGEQLMYGEVEYRATLTRNGLLGMVAFVNATALANQQTGEQLFDAFAHRRRRWAAIAVQQADEHQSRHRLRLGTPGRQGLLPRASGGVLIAILRFWQ